MTYNKQLQKKKSFSLCFILCLLNCIEFWYCFCMFCYALMILIRYCCYKLIAQYRWSTEAFITWNYSVFAGNIIIVVQCEWLVYLVCGRLLLMFLILNSCGAVTWEALWNGFEWGRTTTIRLCKTACCNCYCLFKCSKFICRMGSIIWSGKIWFDSWVTFYPTYLHFQHSFKFEIIMLGYFVWNVFTIALQV